MDNETNFFKDKKILVTGGTGLVGKPLVEMLLKKGAQVSVVSLDDPSRAPVGVDFVRADLREFSNCLTACHDKEIVFHLAGVKGSPAMTREQPASFFVPTIMFNTNVMEAAHRCGVDRFMYTSSYGAYAPSQVFHEDDLWKASPSENDWHAGWAKRIGEMQADAYKKEFEWNKISIIRPANIYGPGDNFDPRTAMVIPSLINKAVKAIEEDKLFSVWGDGSPIRDFIYCEDVARGMLLAVEKGINIPINLGSGVGVSIKDLAETIARYVPGGPIEISWDKTRPNGDLRRLMDTTRAEELLGFTPRVTLDEGIKKTIRWYRQNSDSWNNRYNAFDEGKTR